MELTTRQIERPESGRATGMISVPNYPNQEPLLVAERLTQEILDLLRESTHIKDPDYDFVEGWRSRGGMPGFAIFGKNSESMHRPDTMQPVMTVKYRSLDLADDPSLGAIPEDMFTNPEPVRANYQYKMEADSFSPLGHEPSHPKWAAFSVDTEMAKLLEGLAARPGILSRTNMPSDFYKQFETMPGGPDNFPQQVQDELAKPDNFSIDGRRFIVVVDKYNGSPEFSFGHVRRVHNDGFRMNGSHPLDGEGSKGVFSKDALAIYGKGLIPIYTASKSK